MKKELKNKIVEEFPDLFGNNHPGFHCGDGWFCLIHDACKRLAELGEDAGEFKIRHIKEYYAGLDITGFPRNAIVEHIISEAREASFGVCERCGSRNNVRFFMHRGWEQVACPPCRRMIKKGWEEGCAEFSDDEKGTISAIRNHLLIELNDKLQNTFPGGKAEVVLRTAGDSYIVVRDTEGRIFAV